MTTRRRPAGKWVPAALMALMLAFMLGVIGGCTGGSKQQEKPVVTENAGGGATTPDTPVDSGNNGGSSPVKPVDSGNGGGSSPDTPVDNGNDGSNSPDTPVDNGNNGGSTPVKPVDSGNGGGGGSKEPVVVAENKAFRVFEPAEDAVVGTTFTVRGEARVFEASFSYSFEDGHNVLAEGHVTADMGAPEWGKFEFTVTFDEATNPFGILTIYESSAKDGSPVNVLQIAVKFNKDAIKPIEEIE
ncbi:Gmad2 immunoglobulin-like domain-containing protein [Paenibacillus kobensis]|uniref:Gmad2 immunoglobulin-like domain-containing protein n=1 Tax=Paenibacillus kobensis TaxID=59841 RepID=UPI000FD9475A|nr:Gmad2 immunoglobulin-like domain-containing protein [Paenibacillus kobensis]